MRLRTAGKSTETRPTDRINTSVYRRPIFSLVQTQTAHDIPASDRSVHFIQRIAVYANDCLWPKADIRTESKWWFLDVRFGEKSGRSEPKPSGVVDTIGVGASNDQPHPH